MLEKFPACRLPYFAFRFLVRIKHSNNVKHNVFCVFVGWLVGCRVCCGTLIMDRLTNRCGSSVSSVCRICSRPTNKKMEMVDVSCNVQWRIKSISNKVKHDHLI